MRLFLLLTILLIIPNSLAFLQITEIMYNPEGNDNNKEYIEIYTNLNLTDFTVQDLASSDTLELLQYYPSNFSLIVEENFNYLEINATIYSAGATIGNNLNNEGDIIIIKNQSEIFDTIHYYPSWGGENNNNSICMINEIWQECLSSPGQENSEQQPIYNIKINEFLPNPFGNDNANMPEGEWIELINLGPKINLENFYLEDKANHKLHITQINTYNTTIKDYLAIYTNGFSGLLNNNGTEELKLFDSNGILIDEISYGSSTEGLSWSKIENRWLQTVPTPNEENKYNETDRESRIKIKKIYLGNDDKAKFGDLLRIKLSIYKGNTTKSSISAWVEKNKEKISKTTKFSIEEGYEETPITIPVQIFPNCKQKFKNGEYKLKVEGLGEKDQEDIRIENITKNLCEEIKVASKETYKDQYSETNINPPNSTINKIIYESTNKKTSNSAIYFFCLTLIFVITQMVIEKWKK